MAGRAPAFLGRQRERAALDRMLERVRDGESSARVIRGEAGIGKTALMQYCARQASGCRVTQIAGVESELEMPFAAIDQLCRPILDGIDALPEPQQQALRVAFGLALGTTPERFVVGLAVLGLLTRAAAERPLVCLVDDAQWLDEPSRLVLGFVGRRLLAESVLLLIAVREVGDDQLFPGLESVMLAGLTQEDARSLLMAAAPGRLDEQVRDTIVAETGGNPLRLLELPREMSHAELAGGFPVRQVRSFFGRMEEHYARRVRALPEPTQKLLLLAAADPTGDATLLWRAAHIIGIPRSAAAAAESEQLLEIGARVRFRHPLVRSAAYTAGSPDDRRAAHAALADATDTEVEPERRVWHLASAATGPDEAIAAELEQAAIAAQARAGSAAAAAFLGRSAELTAEPNRRSERALAAAHAHMHAGAFESARALLAEAQAVATGDVRRARIERLRGQIEFAANPGAEAPFLLVRAAKALEPLDVDLARETYLEAWVASFVLGPVGRPGGLLLEVSMAARAAPPGGRGAMPYDLLLDGVATVVIDGLAEGVALLRRAIDAFLSDEISDDEFVRWGVPVTAVAVLLWDWHSWEKLNTKYVRVAQASGALAPLSLALTGRGHFATLCGDFEAATALFAEYDAVHEATGIGWYSVGRLLLAAYQGRLEALNLIANSTDSAAGPGVQSATWTRAVLCNALGRYSEALDAAEIAVTRPANPLRTAWALPEVIEAAVRCGKPDVAHRAMEQLPKHMVSDSDWAAGIEARSRALVTEGDEAARWYAEALRRLARTPFKTELARADLLYGEWLRRGGRRVEAREHLHSAYDVFSAMGAQGFAERTRRELVATGEKVRKRDLATRDELTPQEQHIARLARDGRSNAEIGAELFLSVRTVEWHLRKVFMKLGVSSRKDLKVALPSHGLLESTPEMPPSVR
jgi:DNA-binding CsgD family transcriptional regulator